MFLGFEFVVAESTFKFGLRSSILDPRSTSYVLEGGVV